MSLIMHGDTNRLTRVSRQSMVLQALTAHVGCASGLMLESMAWVGTTKTKKSWLLAFLIGHAETKQDLWVILSKSTGP